MDRGATVIAVVRHNLGIRGENVSRAQLEQAWKTTTQAANGVWDSPIYADYADFFAAVREVNSKLPQRERRSKHE